MRIAYVTETYPPETNGVALTAARTVEHLRRAGHAVLLVRPRQAGEPVGDTADEWRSFGVPLPLYPDVRFGLARRAALARRFEAAAIELVHVATPGPLAWAATAAAHRLHLPATSDFRTRFDCYSRYYGLGWAEPLVRNALRKLHNRGCRTFVPTEGLRMLLARHGYARLEVLGRGVDTARFDPVRRSAALRGRWGVGLAPVLLYAGRLAAEKNVGLALRAFEAARREVPDLRMVVVGDGPARAALQRAHPDAVFAGMQRGAALAEHYASADVFVFPSLTDTFGNVVLEALASGLPVVAYAEAAAAEHVRDGISGRLATPGDEAGFMAACIDLAHRIPPTMPGEARAAALAARWDSVLAAFEHALEATLRAWRGGTTPAPRGNEPCRSATSGRDGLRETP
ncbi:MAG: glycosyltransferase family 1 protein [Proteobacteria bacterium]|nr:glycosyltransferase family 1 protein [Pseudomonadota bacterium]